MLMEDMLYVLGLKKNLILVAILEDKGYIVTFDECNVYIRPKKSKTTKVIGVRKGNLF